MKKIKLHSGPYNNRVIEDLGAITILMGIAREWDGNRPKKGTQVGVAYYEPNDDRTQAHWLTNEWDGISEGTLES